MDKNMITKSEQLFENYCQIHGYSATRIPADLESIRTPDYKVEAFGHSFIIEVKELQPNEEDKRRIRELIEKHFTVGGGTPGKRVFEKIKNAAGQLSKHKDSGLPCVLLLYDNIVVDGTRLHYQNYLLDPCFIDYGIYGLHSVILSKPNSYPAENPRYVGEGRGDKRQLTENQRLYISAVSVLYENQKSGEPFILTYHNFFAKVKLPFDIFSDPYDHHYIKPNHPNLAPQDWVEFKK
jgi:hypothetical protein